MFSSVSEQLSRAAGSNPRSQCQRCMREYPCHNRLLICPGSALIVIHSPAYSFIAMSSKPPRRPTEQKPRVYSGMRSSGDYPVAHSPWTCIESTAAADSEIVDEFLVTTEMQPGELLHPDTMIPIVTDDGNHELGERVRPRGLATCVCWYSSTGFCNH